MTKLKTMEKAYTPQIHDKKWQDSWKKSQISAPESLKKHPSPSGKTFTLMMPPPNVTGVLHQGHALFLALQDTLTRWHRMCGDKTLYLPGTDHASIAVQMQVVKHLEKKGVNYRDIGRTEFLEECWKWIKDFQPRIFSQIESMGVSCDWTRVKFTMDENLNKAVEHAFVELYKKGFIYRAKKLVNWSPKGETVLSDLEVIFEERDTFLWHLKYPLVDNPNQFLIISTTRPETMLGDTAVAVHPDDKRYNSLIGKKIKLPIVDREIPIVGDSFVDQSFGSGVVKITPAHDFTDFDVGLRHKLPLINVFTKDAKIVSGLPSKGAQLAGLDRFEARNEIEKILESLSLLEKKEKYKTRIGKSERWGDVVEPYLSDQWFCKMDSMAQNVHKAALEGEIEFVPNEFHNQFQRWMENIRDWCISRQLWWGQQIPAYYCTQCNHMHVSVNAPKKCEKCSHSELTQDSDVLDTWFSSGLWPFSTLGWPNTDHPDYKNFYPTSVLETGFDILFFWVARMLMMGKELTGQYPFSKVYLHPMVRDENGQKMSKTKGNVIDPLDLIEKFGADTLRMTLNALCVQGRDLRLSEAKVEGYRNFINKIWNATKFVTMDLSSADARKVPKCKDLSDRWLHSRFNATARSVNKSWSEFKMLEAAESLYHFLWDDFCDWYLEISKNRRAEASDHLIYILSEYLKLLHPICPHITEELWHSLPGIKESDTLALEPFPLGESFPDSEALAQFEFIKSFIGSVRTLRAESKVQPNKLIRVYIENAPEISLKLIEDNQNWIQSLAKISELHIKSTYNSSSSRGVLSALEAGKAIEFLVPTEDLVDLKEEAARLQKEVENLEKYLKGQEAKLKNPQFVDKAPPEVVDKEKIKLKETEEKLAKSRQALNNLKIV
ncbi:MAG: valine--tRNA ligase [Proteobacteria bacterium]|nr:valine--tRNA ligase [Pseudomonadota bacterium]